MRLSDPEEEDHGFGSYLLVEGDHGFEWHLPEEGEVSLGHISLWKEIMGLGLLHQRQKVLCLDGGLLPPEKNFKAFVCL